MYLLILTFTFITCLTRAHPAVPPGAPRIVGGVPTTIENHPYAVQVQQNNQLLCGGTLISTRCVLSAAHCFRNSNHHVIDPRAFTVRVGSAAVDSGTAHSVSTIVLHPSYNMGTLDSDIAILVLTSGVTLGTRVRATTLMPAGFTVPDNETVTVVGWGHTIPNDNMSGSAVLNEVQVRMVNFDLCAERYAGLRLLLTANMICAGILDQGSKDACVGDSGGPLLVNKRLVGVVSWGHGCGSAQYPGVYVKLTNYNSWINDTLTRYNAAPSLATSALLLILSIITLLSY